MNKKTINAFLIVPLVPASIGAIQTVVAGNWHWDAVFGLVPIFYWFSLLATIVFGVPIFLVCRRYNIIRWWSSLGAGIVVGVLVSIVLGYPNYVQLEGLIIHSLAGGAAGFVFWLILNFGSNQKVSD